MSNNEPDYADNPYFDENKKTNYYSIVKEYEDYNLEVTTNMDYSIEILKDLLKECRDEISNDMDYSEYNECGKLRLLKQIDEVLNAK